MLKKLLLLSSVIVATLALSACGTKEFTVSFDSQGGTAVADVVVEKDAALTEPTAPTRANSADGKVYSFVGWFTDAAGTTAYDFATEVTADITLYAKWSEDVVLTFDNRTDAANATQLLGPTGGPATAPAVPTRAGYRFGGWFTTKTGLTWLEPEAVTFPYTVTGSTTLYAYWEPLDSKAITYPEGSTYTTSLDSSSSLILNPLTYQWSHENTFIDWMATPLYETEVDWDKAIADGVADAPGDFSKIIAKEFSIEALDFRWILVGGAHFPMDSEGEEYLTEDGLYDRDNASTYKDTEWTFNIRQDLKYEDGTPITSADFEYTLKMFLDPVLTNYRANIYYRTTNNKNGYPIANAYEYYLGEADWAEVGFEIVDDYTFTITVFEAISQAEAVGFANMRLVQEAAFEASLNTERTNSSYGTPDHPYVSYGEYIMKTWDENQKLVFNKNYEYLNKGAINYKSMVIQIVDSIDQRMQLFEQGDLSVAGLSKDYYAQYAESPNVYKSWDGYPQYLIINLAESKLTEGAHVQPDILFDARFRQALLFGFDRKYYATSVYAPNTASLLPVPLDTKSYNQDALYYSESPQHLAVLEALGIDPATEGYIPARAQELFNAAYTAWVNDGNTGPVVLKLISDNDEFSVELVEYVEEMYETLFNTTGQLDKLDIQISYSDPTANRAVIANWDFDLSLNAIGFGSSTGVWWQYQAIAFFGNWIGGGALGLSQPGDMSTEDGLAAYVNQEVTVDLTATYDYLVELGEEYMTEEGLEGHLELYGYLQESTDPDTGAVKAAGIYQGPMQDLALLFVFSDSPWDGSAAEPFPGATNDSWTMVAMLEELYFEHVSSVPTVTRSSATIYAPNVVIEWPAYSSAFGWGANRYRYLNTDPDFQ
jgi:oligopeptide transport system substrate-binding protein